MLKGNLEIIILVGIVIGGIYYSINRGESLWVRKPILLDSTCYGVDVPNSIKLSNVEHFCSCIKMGGHVSQQENTKYCVKQFVEP